MKKQYRLDSGMDTSITLEIDTDKVDASMAAEMNSFWWGGNQVLSASDGDVFEAVARRAAGELIKLMLNGYTEDGSVNELNEMEGWPGENVRWLRIVDCEIPDLSATEFSVTEITREGAV